MTPRPTRRSFLRKSAAAAATLAASRLYVPGILHAANKGDVIRVAMIGCGGQGTGTHAPACAREQIVAMVDPDPSRFAKAIKSAQTVNAAIDADKIQKFDDYRTMFDKIHKQIDAISVATPNHQHALPAMIAMKLGKGAYVEKPLTYTIHETRELARLSIEHKVATQMGNQGHSGEGYRRLCEFIWDGAIGRVSEVYCWSDRANGGVGPRPAVAPVPEGMNWDSWIGPGPFREFHKFLHPHEWHGWHDYGNGSLGNMACHVMDGVHWALKLGHPTMIECEHMLGGSDERYPLGTRIRWDFDARGAMPPVKVWWYDGLTVLPPPKDEKDLKGTAEDDMVKDGRFQNKPPIALELEKKYGRKFESNGTLYVGDKGIIFTGTYGNSISFVPEERMKEYVKPEKLIPRIKGSHHGNFFDACRGGEPAVSNFADSSKLAEFVLLGCLAMRAGVGKKIGWDGPSMQCTNLPELNRLLRREYRKGWEA